MSHSDALVVETFGRRMRLRLASGEMVNSRIKGRKLHPVCGDRVRAVPIDNEPDWLITAIRDRDNVLSRPNRRGDTEVLAANIDLLVVVTAAVPEADWFVVDRYLCAAENMPAAAAVVFNKIDLQDPGPCLDVYEASGYPCIRCSARSGDGIASLGQQLAGRTAIIVGQSGVGKSSIVNALLGRERLRTATISAKSHQGRHTTANSTLLDLPSGGAVIDSPGVRDFAPALQDITRVQHGFREINQAARRCRFADCRHVREPGCAVRDAVDARTISGARYESYRRLLASTEKIDKRP